MTHLPSLRFALSLGLALSACNTEEIAPHQVAIQTTQSDPGQGALYILFSSTDATYAAAQAHLSTNPNLTQYHLFVDGREVVYDSVGSAVPVLVAEGNENSAMYWAGGMHHFEIAASGAPAIFAGDGPIVGGAVNRLYLFGPLDALQGRFTSYAFTPPDGSEHASVINLVRDGRSIELLSCTDASHCAAVSPALALGQIFEGDFPIVASDNERLSLSTTGAGLGYRLLPSPSLPAPPVIPLRQNDFVLGHTTSVLTRPLNFVGAPIYIAPEGNILEEWN
jgi:hypothetical protein